MTRTIDWRFLDGSSFTDITDYFRLYEIEVTSAAEEGSVATSTIRANDPNGVLDIIGHAHIRMFEDAATGSNTCIGQWHTATRKVHRGDYHRVGLGRVWDIDLVDLNGMLSRRVFYKASADRPAETDVARIQWLLTQPQIAIVTDTEFFNTSGAVAMDANDYTGQTPQNILDDCAQQSGKNYFLWYNEGQDAYSLWYDFADSESYSSPLRLSNFLSDVDETWTFAISPDTELARDPSRVFSDVFLPYDGGDVYVFSSDVAYLYPRRSAVMPSLNVKSAAKAEARARRYLTELDTEDDVITTTVILPAAKVNFLMQGMRVQFRASHLPGYSSFQWLRVLTRTVRELSETDERTYAVTLELSKGQSAAEEEPGGTCDGGEYALTESGYYAPLNSLTTNNDAVFYYWNPGTVAPTVPTPGHVGNWHFPQLGSGGLPDYAGDCSQNYLRTMVVGDGVIEIETRQFGGASRGLLAYLRHVDASEPGGFAVDEDQVGNVAGDTVTFNVSTHGGTECVHFVDIVDDGDTCGSKWGFAGATWTASA